MVPSRLHLQKTSIGQTQNIMKPPLTLEDACSHGLNTGMHLEELCLPSKTFTIFIFCTALLLEDSWVFYFHVNYTNLVVTV